MEKTILIGGKDVPDGSDFASGAALHGRKVFITSRDSGSVLDSGASAVAWNHSSSISARSVVLSCMNSASRLDEAVLVFDEVFYAPKYGEPGATESNHVFDELILGYQFLAAEIVSRFSQRRYSSDSSAPGKLVFLYKSNISQAQAVLNPNLHTGQPLSKTLVAASAAAFRAFAENFAASLVESEDCVPVLIECDSSNETARKDSVLSGWLCDYLDSLDGLKKPLTAKQKVSWIKAGAKSPGGFSLFR